MESAQIESKVGEGIAHQGYALCCSPLPVKTQQELIAEIEAAHDSSLSLPNQNLPKLLILDQLNDSHNVGAIIRSACAFGVKKIIFPSNNFPKENAAINKSSSAAIEEVDLIAASNINDLINKLKDLGYFCVALDSHVESSLADAKSNRNIALVIGSEAEGIRQLVKKNCDLVAKIDAVEFESLNASCAAAIALYEIFGKAEVR